MNFRKETNVKRRLFLTLGSPKLVFWQEIFVFRAKCTHINIEIVFCLVIILNISNLNNTYFYANLVLIIQLNTTFYNYRDIQYIRLTFFLWFQWKLLCFSLFLATKNFIKFTYRNLNLGPPSGLEFQGIGEKNFFFFLLVKKNNSTCLLNSVQPICYLMFNNTWNLEWNENEKLGNIVSYFLKINFCQALTIRMRQSSISVF